MGRIIDEHYAPSHEIASWDFPLYSEILPGLWLGGTDDDDTIDFAADVRENRRITANDFDAVVTLYAWAQPVDWFVPEFRYGFYDSDKIIVDHVALGMMVDFVMHHWKEDGKKVLIRCQAGINRSSFVMAFVLMRYGYSAADAIALMREKRSPYVLMNQSFEKFLLEAGRKETQIES